MASFLGVGAWLDRFDPETSRLLRALKPNFAVVGEGAWNQIPQIRADMASGPLLILRFVGTDISWKPDRLAFTLNHVAKSFPGHFAAYGINEPDVSTSLARFSLVEWELDFISECHRLGLPTVCLNLATGNPPGNATEMLQAMEELRPIHNTTDYVGLHLYNLYNATGGIDSLYTAFRYRLWPAWFRRNKLLSTEIGIDGEGQRLGWRDWGSEQTVIDLMHSLTDRWMQDGILGGAFFHLGTMNSEWDSYLASEELMTALSVYNISINNDGYVSLPEAHMDIQEMTLRDMWRRQGVEAPANGSNAFWDYARAVAQAERRVIVPQPSKDGNFENHDDPTFVIAYTIPALHTIKGQWGVTEGLPPL